MTAMLDVDWAEAPCAHADAVASVGVADDDLARLLASVRAAFEAPHLNLDEKRRVAWAAEDAARTIRRRRDAVSLDRMRRELDLKAAELAQLNATLLRSRTTLQGALSVAGAGLWECRLSDERLSWTSGVYDLFDAPQGAVLHRQDMIGCYVPASRKTLERLRDEALRTGGGFRLDAEIVTLKGRRRWIRLSARAERRGPGDVRLYGMKQDVTDEKAQADEIRHHAEVDALTGLANRRLFEEKLATLAASPDAALLLVDLDRFKELNDTLGHVTGDAYLKLVAERLRSASRGAALVARIGGDEFAVLFGAGKSGDEIERSAQNIVEALKIPIERGDFLITLGASVGSARAAGLTPSDWLARADGALYAAKAAGRGTFRTARPSDLPRERQDVRRSA